MFAAFFAYIGLLAVLLVTGVIVSRDRPKLGGALLLVALALLLVSIARLVFGFGDSFQRSFFR